MDRQSLKTQAVDLSHHINVTSRSRHPSPLKDIIKFMGYDGMISLAGGLPHPSMFPVNQASFDCLPPSAPPLGETAESDLVSLNLRRDTSPGEFDLTPFLQYGTGSGNRELLKLAAELTEQVHAPPCQYECLLNPGNTNAWSKVVGLLCEHDDYVLVDEFTYPSAQALWIPFGIKAAPVSADAEGILATSLRELLEHWDEKSKGNRRPKVLYLVPVGSNPTGITISVQRRWEIYAVCVEFDLVIVEDDPYYFLQYPGYTPQAVEQNYQPKSTELFLKSLVPSFLSIDTQGRVIRLESFSKTLFPGLRLGYFIANPFFIERLLRATEVETQDPAGLSQAFIISLFRQWGNDGYLLWLQSLQFQYKTRRDWMLSAFYDNFTVLSAEESPIPTAQGYVACLSAKTNSELRPVFSFVDPEAGMFVWSKFYFDGVRRFEELEGQSLEDPEQAFAQELWEAMINERVLLTPGSYYHAWQGPEKASTKARGADPRSAYFRLSFATPTKDQIHEGVKRLQAVLGRFWGAAK